MKPLVLRMTAFGPYAEQQTLDFEELKGRSFFLIHGPTGSGKTSILDAICFALYGNASGNSRTGKSLRSDHADLSLQTEVEFEFAIGAKQYKVMRWPEQERPSKRGGGTTISPAKAELFLLSENGIYELLASSWREVTEKVETLLGFKSEQFRQVVLLPQGDFRKLLTATSEERQAIMQTLFKTNLYSLIEDKLKNKAKELTQLRKELVHDQELILQEATVTTLGELEIRLEQNRLEEAELNTRVGDWDQKLRVAQEEITKASRIQDQWTEREAAETELQSYTAKIPTVNQFRFDLEQALAAATLMDAEAHLAQQTQDVNQLKNILSSQEELLESAKQQLEITRQALSAQENKAPEREAAAADLHRLQQLSGAVQALTLARTEAGEAQSVVKTMFERRTQSQLQLEEVRKTQEERTERARNLLLLSTQSEPRKLELEKLQSFSEKRQTLDGDKKKLLQIERKLSATQRNVTESETALKELKQVYAALQQAWLNGQAGIMASQLTLGSPCPVCGSTHHPQPANLYSETPDELTLKRKQTECEHAEADSKLIQESYHQQATERDLLAQKVQSLTEELGDYAQIDLQELSLTLDRARTSYQETLQATQRLETLQQELANGSEQQTLLQKNREDLEKTWLQANEAYQKAQGIFEERQATVSPDLREPLALQKALHAAQTLQARLNQDWETAQKAWQDTSQRLTKLQADFDNTFANLNQAEERLNQLLNDFSERLKTAGFASSEEYLRARWQPERIKKVQDHLKEFELSLSAAEQRAQRSKEKTEGLSHPDLPKLKQDAATIKNEYDSFLRQHTALQNRIQAEKRWCERLNALNQELETLSSRYALIGRLSEVANGQNDYRLTLQRFVLGALLDDVALAANERLKTMSRGRYFLQRTMDRARKNMAGGLDLEVFDNYTGFARGVGTLSGGETFLASLSLALGLVDVVQSYAGGIHLDTLFVDEGFGTLDPESLDFAIKALIDLQQGGRLVGIISHVPELKERIDARLEVMPTSKGSVASFKVG